MKKDWLYSVKESDASEEAQRQGLYHIGAGRYVSPDDPKTVVAQTIDGRLVPVQKQPDEGKEQVRQAAKFAIQAHGDQGEHARKALGIED